MTTFGERLKDLREKAGMSQAELAEKSGTSQRAISSWENDTREPLISAVQKLCAALGVSCEVFMKEDKPAPKKGKK